MDAELAAVFFCLVLGISVDRIQASSTIPGSLPPSSSTPALPKASSTESTSSVFRAPSSQVTAVSGSVNATDLSTTTSLSSSSIVAEISTILASISRNATVSPVTAASLTPSSGISSTSQRKSANLTGENKKEVVTSFVGSLSASASTILTTSSIILPLSQTTSSRSLSSSKRTVSSSGLESPSLGTTLASSSENTSSVFRASISQDISVSGSVNSADLSTTTSPSSSWIVSTSRSVAINTTTSSLKSVSVNSALTTTQTISSLSFSSTWGLQSGNVTSSFVPSLKNTQSDPTSNSMPTAMLTSPAPSKSLSVDSSSKNVSDATSTTLSIGSSVHTVSPSLSLVTTEGFPETPTIVASTTATSFTTSNRILSTLQSKSASFTEGNTIEVVNSPVGSLSASASTILTSFSGILSTSQIKSASLTEANMTEDGKNSMGSLWASASTILTFSSRILSPSQTTSYSSLSSSKRTVSSSESPSLSTTPSSSWIVSTSRSVAINTTTSSLKSVSVNSALTTTQTVSSLSFSSTWGLQSGNVTSSFVPSLKNTQSDPTSNSMPTAMLTSPAPSKSPSVDSSSKNVSDATSTTLSIGSSVHTVSPSLSSVTTEGFPETVSTTRGTLASTRIYATLSERLSSYPASTPATHTSSPRPTIPPEGTKMVNMEVTLNMEFREDYNDVNSPVYKELVANLSKALFRVYQEVDGFVGVQVLFIRRGSIVCNYIVILASNSKVTDDDLKKELHEGRKDGKFPFDVKGIAVIEDSDAVAAKTKLPQWAMTTMIVLGALSFCFLVIAICACIKYRNAMSSENYIYDVPPGKLDMRAYDAISMGHMRANVDGNTSTAQRRLVSSHENPTYGS